jgi:hypothetical protein
VADDGDKAQKEQKNNYCVHQECSSQMLCIKFKRLKRSILLQVYIKRIRDSNFSRVRVRSREIPGLSDDLVYIISTGDARSYYLKRSPAPLDFIYAERASREQYKTKQSYALWNEDFKFFSSPN